MQLLFIFSFLHGPGMRFEGCLFLFRLYLSSNSNDKPRTLVFSAKIQKSKISKKARGTRPPPLLVPVRGPKIGQNFVEMVPGDRVCHEDSESHLGKSKRRSDGRMVAN